MTDGENKILVSIIIPCRNEENYIRKTIRNIYDSDFDMSGVEVLVVDGISDDNTRTILSELLDDHRNLKVIDNEHKTTPFAFNLGIKNSNGDYILIVGARHIISKNYIKGCLQSLQEDETIGGVGGKVINIYEDDTSKAVSLAMNSSFGVGIGNFRVFTESAIVDTIGTPMYRKGIFQKVGLFSEELSRNQDDEFNYRVIKAGYKLWLNCDINISYYVRSNISKLFKQYFQYGYWKVYVNKKLKTITTFRQLIPFLFVVFLVFYPVVLILNETLFILYPIVILLYLLILTSVSIYASKGLNKTAIVTFISFISLHFGYGIGYFNGFVDFILLRKIPNEKMTSLSR